MNPQPWLIETSRRTLKDKGKRRSPEEIYKLITLKSWPYKMASTSNFYETRDKAFLSLLYLVCGRVSEIVKGRIKKNQFERKGQFLYLNDYQVLKTYLYRDPWPIPLEGRLSKFTKLLLDYLILVPCEGPLFRFGRSRAHQITKHITGFWPHWFRAQGESHYMTIIKNPLAFANALKLKQSDTLKEYVPFEWGDYEAKISE